MTESTPGIDYANIPSPAEGILVTLFITVRKVARSRDFYSRVLGGTVVLDENPCIVKLSNSWIIMNPGGGVNFNALWPAAVAAGAGKPTTSPGLMNSEALAAYFGLDQPIPAQYWHWLTGLLQGELAAKRPEDLPG